MLYISKYFRFDEAFPPLMLNRIDHLPLESLRRLFFVFEKLDQVREFFDAPLKIHSAYRTLDYNHSVGGSKDSPHMAQRLDEAAVDFDVMGITCAEVQKRILEADMLNIWGMRMENHGANPSWIHLDTRIPPPGHPRFFVP